jgi:hypothetical protein
MFPLEIRQLDMRLVIKEKIRRLDIAVKNEIDAERNC